MRYVILTALLVCVPALVAQTNPTFEVVSIRPGSMKPVQLPTGMSVIGGSQGGPGTADPELLRMNSTTLKSVITRAYGVKPYQVSGPAWIETNRYDITAKVLPGATKEQFDLMLQSMLEDRFHLKLHHETKDFKAYNLVEAKGGFKLKDAVSTDACSSGGRPVNGTCPPGAVPISGVAKSQATDRPMFVTVPKEGGFIATGRAAPMLALASTLELQLKGPLVIDKTGIEGTYNFRFEFAPPDVGTSGDFSFPSIFTALEKELGLKLEPTSEPLDTIVVDHIDPPTEN